MALNFSTGGDLAERRDAGTDFQTALSKPLQSQRWVGYSDQVSNIILELDENGHTAHSGILLGVLMVGFPVEKEGPVDSLSAKLSITEPGEDERIDWYSIGESVWIGEETWQVAKVTAPERDMSLDGSGVDSGPMVTLHRTL